MQAIAEEVGYKLLSKAWFLTTAESCTGGLIAKLLTDVPGSSQWFDRGFVTYTNEAKEEMLAVSELTLRSYGAVSEQTVTEMASGAIESSRAQCSVAISGVAGPTGGSAEKPVGTVCFAWCIPESTTVTETHVFEGDREQVREKAALYCLQKLSSLL